MEQERGHRRFCQPFASALNETVASGYKVGALDCARYFVVKNACEGGKRPKSWADFASYREDVALSFALHDMLKAAGAFKRGGLLCSRPACCDLDYSKDIANH